MEEKKMTGSEIENVEKKWQCSKEKLFDMMNAVLQSPALLEGMTFGSCRCTYSIGDEYTDRRKSVSLFYGKDMMESPHHIHEQRRIFLKTERFTSLYVSLKWDDHTWLQGRAGLDGIRVKIGHRSDAELAHHRALCFEKVLDETVGNPV